MTSIYIKCQLCTCHGNQLWVQQGQQKSGTFWILMGPYRLDGRDEQEVFSGVAVVHFRSLGSILTEITEGKQDCHCGHITLQGHPGKGPMLKNNEWKHLRVRQIQPPVDFILVIGLKLCSKMPISKEEGFLPLLGKSSGCVTLVKCITLVFSDTMAESPLFSPSLNPVWDAPSQVHPSTTLSTQPSLLTQGDALQRLMRIFSRQVHLQ